MRTRPRLSDYVAMLGKREARAYTGNDIRRCMYVIDETMATPKRVPESE